MRERLPRPSRVGPRRRRLASIAATAMLVALPVRSWALPEWRDGHVIITYAEPDRLVVGLTTAGPCGNEHYVIPRSNTNFRELYSLVLMAFASGKGIAMQVGSCSGAENVVTYGAFGPW